MTDREYLELAAKAAGLAIDKSYGDKTGFDVCDNVVLDWLDGVTWNPITDDGDALRLAASQGMTVYTNICGAYVRLEDGHEIAVTEEPSEGQLAATRRAIVRAAAEIGRSTKPFPSADEIREEWI